MLSPKVKAIIFVTLILNTNNLAWSTTVGKASYADILPSAISSTKRPPADKYVTANISGPIPTTKWFSSLVCNRQSYSHYAYPLAMYVVNDASYTGLQIGFPRVSVFTDAVTAPFIRDLEIRGDLGSRDLKADSVKVDAFSDWTVTPYWQDTTAPDEYFKATYGHGLVYVYFEFSANCNPKVAFLNSIEQVFTENGNIANGAIATDHLGVKYNDVYYGLFAPVGSNFVVSNNQISVTLPAGQRYFSVGLLPAPGDLAYFYQHAYAFVTNTEVSWNYNEANNEVTSVFTVSTLAKQNNQTTTLMALLPHQYKHSTALVSETRTYGALLGKMKLAEGNDFTVTNRFYGVLPYLPDKGSYDRAYLQQLLNKDKTTSLTKRDSYFNGKQLAKVANLIPIANQLKDSTTRDELISQLKTVLTDWFTCDSGETDRFFYYDNVWKGLIGYEALFYGYYYTDHHYHNGYLVYAAAILAGYDSSFKNDYGAFVEYLIKDYANWNRQDAMFPFLRSFDPYLGHSYAAGLLNIDGNGNNQESSSESMNGWAAIILWGMVTGNNTIRDLGIWGYTTEYTGIHDYYFNMDSDIYPSGYQHKTVGILFDSRAEYTTWWTGEDEAIHGIQMIPLTASMLYLGYSPEYCRANYDSFFMENRGYEDYNEWYDILWKYQCFYDPDLAIGKLNENVGIDIDGDSFTFLYHWIYNFKVLGKVDISVSANTPYYAVFNNGGTRTYVAYNPASTTRKITFSGAGSLGSLYAGPGSLVAAKVFAPEVSKVEADSSSNQGKSVIRIEGAGFQNGANVYLRKSGEDSLTASRVIVSDSAQITAEINLRRVSPGNWELVVVNPGGDLESGQPNNFLITGNMPDNSNEFYLYPNPCRQKQIDFVNIPAGAQLEIYNLAGDLVFSQGGISANPFVWKLENGSGRAVASGIYFYVMRHGRNCIKGKIAILR